jgi:hypothetical protein
MPELSNFELFWWGIAGATGAELVSLRALFERDRKRWFRYRKSFAYWILSIVFVVFGGLTAMAQGWAAELSPWVAMNIGFTWPLLLRRGAGIAPDVEPGTIR